MSKRSPVREEFHALGRLGVPVVLGQLGTMLLHSVDTLILGRHDVHELAAATLGTQWIFLTLTVALGCVMGIDPIVAQQHGAGDKVGTALSLQRGLVIALFCTVIVSGSWLLTEKVLLIGGQEPVLARLAHRYVIIQLPSVFPFLAFAALRSYLQGRGIVAPAMWVMLPVNLLNLLLNWILVFGPGPFAEFGLDGAAWATTISRCCMGPLLLFWVRRARLYEGAWVTPDWKRRFQLSDLKVPLSQGLPMAIQMGFEVGAFALTALVAGQLGTIALGAHSVVLSIAALLFMIPLGLSVGATTRIGNLIGAGQVERIRPALWAALCWGVLAVAFNVSFLILGRHALASAYTNSIQVASLAATTFVVAAIFQASDCTQVISGGILRGMKRPRFVALATFVGYYLFGIPVGHYLAAHGRGLPGLWLGLALGLTVVAFSLVFWVIRSTNRLLHGHARMAAGASASY